MAAIGLLIAGILGSIAMDSGYLQDAPAMPTMAKPTVCTSEINPVCGVDRVTYGNLCEAFVAEVEVLHKGECGEMTEETTPVVTEPEISAAATVSIPEGSGMPGCEETDECYIPSKITIKAGETVVWENGDVAFHSVTSGLYDSPTDLFDSGHLDPMEKYSVTFEEPGVYDYFCTLHPWMEAQVIVE